MTTRQTILLNRLEYDTFYPSDYIAEDTRDNQAVRVHFKTDSATGLILDCKWTETNQAHLTPGLHFLSEEVIGLPIRDIVSHTAEILKNRLPFTFPEQDIIYLQTLFASVSPSPKEHKIKGAKPL